MRLGRAHPRSHLHMRKMELAAISAMLVKHVTFSEEQLLVTLTLLASKTGIGGNLIHGTAAAAEP